MAIKIGLTFFAIFYFFAYIPVTFAAGNEKSGCYHAWIIYQNDYGETISVMRDQDHGEIDKVRKSELSPLYRVVDTQKNYGDVSGTMKIYLYDYNIGMTVGSEYAEVKYYFYNKSGKEICIPEGHKDDKSKVVKQHSKFDTSLEFHSGENGKAFMKVIMKSK